MLLGEPTSQLVHVERGGGVLLLLNHGLHCCSSPVVCCFGSSAALTLAAVCCAAAEDAHVGDAARLTASGRSSATLTRRSFGRWPMRL